MRAVVIDEFGGTERCAACVTAGLCCTQDLNSERFNMVRTALRTPAWLLIGLTRSEPGVLELADGVLAFTTEGGRLFAASLSEVGNVRFPWYYFGGGVKLSIGSVQYRLSFVRPNDASDIPGRLMARTEDGGGAALLTTGRKIMDIGEGRRAGKAWRAALTG